MVDLRPLASCKAAERLGFLLVIVQSHLLTRPLVDCCNLGCGFAVRLVFLGRLPGS
jgi:hypothetical protein